MTTFFQLLKGNAQFWSAAAISGLIAIRLGNQTIFLREYRKKLLQAYKDGVETPVDKHTKELCHKVIDKYELKPEVEADTHLFTCLSQDPVYKGSTHLRTGSIIGLPANFVYKSIDNIETSKIQIGQKAFNWDSLEGKSFAESLILSDNAKRFVMARQINYLQSLYIYIDNGLVVLFSILAYWGGHAANVLLRLQQKLPTGIRVIMYSCFASIAATLYFIAKDEYYCYLDQNVDRKAAALGKGFASGGVEYYTKELQRNKALRILLGDYGQKVYTPYGNYVSLWRLPHAPPTTRKAELERYLLKVSNDECSETLVSDGVTSGS